MLLEILVRFIWATLLLGVVYISYLAIERLFLSPLRSIPGPKIAALTGWYETYYDVFQPAQYVFKIKEMHDKYGPIVRISPRLVSISDCEYVDTIYDPGYDSKRDKDTVMVKALGYNASVGGAWQHDLHKKRRQSLNNFFSQSMVLKFEPRLREKVKQLHEIFQDAEGKQEINLSDVYFGFASDVANQFAFGHNQNVLANLARAHGMRTNVARVLQTAKVNLNFSWIRDLIMSLPRSIGKRLAPPGAADMIRFRAGVRKDIESVAREEGSVLPAEKDGNPSIFRELLNSPTLPPSEKTIARLEDEGTLMIMAGTESPAKSMWTAHYHLLAQPEIMRKLRTELSTHNASTLTQLLQLPYLNGVATEAHRLTFGLTGRNSRVAPDQTLTYTNPQTKESYTIPPGTPLSTSTLLAHTDAAIFPDPWRFDPDRWLGKAGQTRRKYMLSFGKGTRQCIGMRLAHAELAVTVAEMARWDMTLFETDDTDVRFAHDWHVAHPRRGFKGVRAKVLLQVELSST